MVFKIVPRTLRIPRTKGEFVTVTRHRYIIPSTEFAEKHLKDVKAVRLLYDKIRNIVGLELLDNMEDEDAYPLRVYGRKDSYRGRTLQIQSESFCRHYRIEPSRATRHVPFWNSKYGVWELHLVVEGEPPESATRDLERNFERFSRDLAAGSRRGNYISITTSGRIMFASGFGLKHLGDYKFAEIYFDEERRVLGIKPVKEMSEAAFELRFAKDKGPKRSRFILINVSAFLRVYKIDYSQIRRYEPTWSEAAELWEIDLNNPLKDKKDQ